ncbi:MAG: hypothetical protein II588_03480 [Paludibacteraceae bacterium]|nr:hypothetical protein [Paludibacteraceae bacterium]
MQNYKLIAKVSLISLLVIGIVMAVLFYVGGNLTETHIVAGDELAIPRFTDLFLTWNYILLGLVCLITLCFVCMNYIELWKTNQKKAITTTAVLCGFVLLAVICWFLGSPEKINIIGYEGTDNQGAWAQLSDMMIYLCYFLLGGTLLTILGGWIYTKTLNK